MPWVVGIDEAGYGPNLGPLVQAAVALRLPENDPAGWDTLRPWVRRCHERDDGRLLIDDSKKVYAGAKGFQRLACAARCGLLVIPEALPKNPDWSNTIWNLFALSSEETLAGLRAECWLNKNELISPEPVGYEDQFGRHAAMMSHLGGISMTRTMLVAAPRFNRRIDETGSKATLLADGLIEVLREVPHLGRVAGIDYSAEPVLVVCDKQGGRNFYGPLLQEAFPDGWIVPEREGAAESRYRVAGLGREVAVVFRPKADGDSVCVALASMVCKYLREVCMMQFNAFWQKHVPGLKPTAGYPVDAKRFYAEIQPAMVKLGLQPDAVWRKK
ncbi:hypothetical protein [Limnoglobus roseus]|uniref:Uncharacterized protein n=1 Tax=Limnoglobus roseus TaxID=2598579 RepID=A0A5C1ANR3_9BACT|nr:hypothetical protein [Limnoglobus roseus]QEL19646.1 hypothetical protein PX52LOC_06723 [Limnoglobus roseus]